MTNANAKIMEAAGAVRAFLLRGEEEGGSEIVQTVIVLGFAVGLGAALLALQGKAAGEAGRRRNRDWPQR